MIDFVVFSDYYLLLIGVNLFCEFLREISVLNSIIDWKRYLHFSFDMD